MGFGVQGACDNCTSNKSLDCSSLVFVGGLFLPRRIRNIKLQGTVLASARVRPLRSVDSLAHGGLQNFRIPKEGSLDRSLKEGSPQNPKP